MRVSPARPVARSKTSHGASSLRGVALRGIAVWKQTLRSLALRECGQRCVYCAVRLDARTATLDHVMPRAHGGQHDVGNLVAACGPCNRLKGDQLPFEFFARHPWAGANFVRYARHVHRALKRGARRAVSLACARLEGPLAA
jgi:5-methylcytosine-specific restriction endonuclease McrA